MHTAMLRFQGVWKILQAKNENVKQSFRSTITYNLLGICSGTHGYKNDEKTIIVRLAYHAFERYPYC